MYIYEILEWTKLIYTDRKQVSGCLRLGREGDCKEVATNYLGKWKFSLSMWWWLHGCMHLTKLIELCTLNCYIFMACKLYPNNVFNKARWDGILKRSCSQGVRT